MKYYHLYRLCLSSPTYYFGCPSRIFVDRHSPRLQYRTECWTYHVRHTTIWCYTKKITIPINNAKTTLAKKRSKKKITKHKVRKHTESYSDCVRLVLSLCVENGRVNVVWHWIFISLFPSFFCFLTISFLEMAWK